MLLHCPQYVRRRDKYSTISRLSLQDVLTLKGAVTRASICRAKVYAVRSRLQFVRRRNSYKAKCVECVFPGLRWHELYITSVSWATPSAQEAHY